MTYNPATPIFAARLYKTSNQILTENVSTVVTWDAAVNELLDVWENVTNPSRITTPTGFTKIRLKAFVMWEFAVPADYETTQMRILKNGGELNSALVRWNTRDTREWGANSDLLNPQNFLDSGWIDTVGGDYWELSAYQRNSNTDTRYVFGATTTATSWIEVELRR